MPELALSTRWNAYRHQTGQSLVQEILDAGFTRIELGYDLTLNLVPGVKECIEQGLIRVGSVHNFCPVPIGAPYGHPELFLLADPNERSRASAVLHTSNTIEFAAEVGAGTVVVHAGNVDMKNMTRQLLKLCDKDKQYSPRYDRTKLKLIMRREKKVGKHLDALRASLDELLPILRSKKVTLALENLPSWESIPTETEMESILADYPAPEIGYWHDMGHGRVRQQLGFTTHHQWAERLSSRLSGMHIHDVAPPARDHIMPPSGDIDFESFKDLAQADIPLVLEPMPGLPLEELTAGAAFLTNAWDL